MEQWSTLITSGSDIDLEIAGVDFKTYVDIKKALAGLERVRSVEGDFSNHAAKLRIKALIQPPTFAELLADKPFAGWFEVLDVKGGRIEAKAKTEGASAPPRRPAE